MEGNRLILNDGTTIENGSAGYADGSVWLYLPGYTMQQAAAFAFDSSKTSSITYQYGDMQDVYTGYTDCVGMLTNYDGLVSVCMKQP